VKEWRDSGYNGASATSSALLKWWFQTEHLTPDADGNMFSFKYYFAQREAVETIIYLHEIVKIKDKYDLLHFDSSGAVSAECSSKTGCVLLLKWQQAQVKRKF